MYCTEGAEEEMVREHDKVWGNVVKFYPVSLAVKERGEVRYDMFPKLGFRTDGGREQI